MVVHVRDHYSSPEHRKISVMRGIWKEIQGNNLRCARGDVRKPRTKRTRKYGRGIREILAHYVSQYFSTHPRPSTILERVHKQRCPPGKKSNRSWRRYRIEDGSMRPAAAPQRRCSQTRSKNMITFNRCDPAEPEHQMSCARPVSG